MQRAQNPGGIDNGADVRAVRAPSGECRRAQRVHQVQRIAVGQLIDQRLRVGVVQHHAFGVLREAGSLLIGGFQKTALVDLDAQAPRRQLSARLQRRGIELRRRLHIVQIGFQAHALPTRLFQVLSGAHKRAWPPPHRIAQGVKVAACLRRQKEQSLLRLCGNLDENAFVAGIARPRFHAGKPLRRRGIGRSAQECHHQHEVRGLAFGQIGVNPEAVAGEQMGYLGDGQGYVAALHVHIDLRAGEIEGRAIGIEEGGNQEEGQQVPQTTAHTFILRTSTAQVSGLAQPRSLSSPKKSFVFRRINSFFALESSHISGSLVHICLGMAESQRIGSIASCSSKNGS